MGDSAGIPYAQLLHNRRLALEYERKRWAQQILAPEEEK
jgi:hypothetical protein